MSGHKPVLLNEAIESLSIKPDGIYLDCTGGLGGHSQEILKSLGPDGRLFISDYHQKTAEKLSEKFKDDNRVSVLNCPFSQVFDNLNFSFDGILADFGISSVQLDDEFLGIGFQVEDVPLDMRIDKTKQKTAADFLRSLEEEELANIFYLYGGETASRKIARAIVHDRREGKYYETTTGLRDLCARVLGRFYRSKKIHPATKVFQALRIVVNDELGEVERLVEKAPSHLAVEGRLVLISFHSGEDRLVKQKFKDLGMTKEFKLVVKKAIKPTQEEIKENSRARSARMRVLARAL